MFDRIDISRGVPFKDKLRFDLNEYILKIKHNSEWQMIPKLDANMKHKEIPIILEDVLFDTGNEANYCIMPFCYYKPFSNLFKQIEFNYHTRKTIKSKEMIKFRFNDMVEFETYIVFFSGKIYENWLNSINIGIDAVLQFVSIIYPTNSEKLKNRFICYHQPT